MTLDTFAESHRIKPKPSLLWILAGSFFMLIWLAGSVAGAGLMLMGSLMANDSGQATPESHMTLIVGVFLGQVLIGLSGIPAGLAFFWRGRKKLLLILFLSLLIFGALCVGLSMYLFFKNLV